MRLLLSLCMLLLSSCALTTPIQKIRESNVFGRFNAQYDRALCSFSFQKVDWKIRLTDKIEEVALVYEVIVKQNDIAHVREVSVEWIDLFINMINKNQEMQPHLQERTLSPKQFTLVLYLMNAKGVPFEKGEVTMMVFHKNMLCYGRVDPKTGSPTNLHMETYEEAKNIIDQQKREASEPASVTLPTVQI